MPLSLTPLGPVPLSLALLALAVAVVTLGPLVLRTGRWQVRHPGLALAAWHGALLSGLAAIALAGALALAAAVS
ncbi:MAG: hypothetical protein QM635_11025, partial [Microbacteriaceae bacterium]